MAGVPEINKSSNFPRRISSSKLSVAEFIQECLIKNQPLITTECTQNWLASKQWLNDDGSANFQFLLDQFGNCNVPVTCCESEKVKMMLFSDFIQEQKENPLNDLYVRDWHFMSDTGFDIEWYKVPRYFQNDWVNNDAFVSNEAIFSGDYRFCYMGSSGTLTSFHSDVFNSYSWSANICGKKRWYMLPEGAELKLSTHPDNVKDLRMDSKFSEAGGFIFEQLPGEIVFVPSGWYHQGFTISINHNWINSFNFAKVINLMFERLNCCMKEVRLMRNDLTEHVKYVEEFLRLDYGLDLDNAIALCELIFKNRAITSDVDEATLTDRCKCLIDNSNFPCNTCKLFQNNNDISICKNFVNIFQEKKSSLNELKWLDEKN